MCLGNWTTVFVEYNANLQGSYTILSENVETKTGTFDCGWAHATKRHLGVMIGGEWAEHYFRGLITQIDMYYADYDEVSLVWLPETIKKQLKNY